MPVPSSRRLDALRADTAIATGERLARLRGAALRDYRSCVTAWLDEAFFSLADALEVDFLIECGAHDAVTSMRFVAGGKGRALAIEANPHTYRTITVKAEEFGVRTLNAGLSDEEKTAPFYIPRGSDCAPDASLLRKTGEAYDSVDIPLVTLDSLYRTCGIESEAVALWVDVEGMATRVFDSGRALLASARCKLIKVEVETTRFWGGQALAEDVDALMHECGLAPVLRDIESDGQHNVLYVRDSSISGLDEALLQQWALLRCVRGRSWSSRKVRSAGARIKAKLIEDDKGATLFHRAAAALGSASSARVLQRRKLDARSRRQD